MHFELKSKNDKIYKIKGLEFFEQWKSFSNSGFCPKCLQRRSMTTLNNNFHAQEWLIGDDPDGF